MDAGDMNCNTAKRVQWFRIVYSGKLWYWRMNLGILLSFIIQVSCWHTQYVDRIDRSGILCCVSMPDKFYEV